MLILGVAAIAAVLAQEVPKGGLTLAIVADKADKPYIIGALWNLKALPPVPSQMTTIKTIRTQAGNQIVLADTPPSVTIQSSAPAAVPATPAALSNLIVSPDGDLVWSYLSRAAGDHAPTSIVLSKLDGIARA